MKKIVGITIAIIGTAVTVLVSVMFIRNKRSSKAIAE